MPELWTCQACGGTGKEVREIEEEVPFVALEHEWWETKMRRIEISCRECKGTGHIETKEDVA